MAFIETVAPEDALGEVAEMYEGYEANLGYLPNYARVFSLRPQVMGGWTELMGSIRHSIDDRRYELVTLAAARALTSSYCMLAHGTVLIERFYAPEQLVQIAEDFGTEELTPAEAAMMRYAEQIVHDATAVTQADIEALRDHGFTDAEIVDIALATTARCFFSKTLDALGAEPDGIYRGMDATLRETLTVGRAIEA